MAATHYGITAGGWTPAPDFRASRDASGLWTASQTFAMPHDTWENTAYLEFTRGTPITDLFPELNSKWNFLELEEADVQSIPGGIHEVFCTFNGFDEAEFPGDEREVTYFLTGTLQERSMLLHPLYVREVPEEIKADGAIISQAYEGLWAGDDRLEDDDIRQRNIYHVPTDGRETTLTNSNTVKWWRLIIDRGVRTYKAPTLQWTCETANKGGLDEDDVESLGLVDGDPPGEPPQPFEGDFEWIKISLDDTRAKNSSANSQTWELSPAGGMPKFDDELQQDGNKGPYEYDLDSVT